MKRLATVAALCATTAVQAAAPAEVYQRVRPSVLALETLDAAGATLDRYTAVALGRERAASVCDVLDGAAGLRLYGTAGSFDAVVLARDVERNLCLLAAAGLDAPPLAAAADSAPAVGTRVFALSNALGLGIGLSDGLVAGVRRYPAGDYIQFSAPVSPGSQGGALVDAEGRLLGLIDYRHRDGQNVNFAASARWLAEIEARRDLDRTRRAFADEAVQLQHDARWQELAALAGRWSAERPQDADAWRWRALAAGELGDLPAEEAAWRKLREIDPQAVNAGLGLARVLLREGRPAEAQELAHGLLALRREDAEIWTALAQSHHALRAPQSAEEAYRKALSFNPWLWPAHQGLILLAQQRGDAVAVAEAWAVVDRLYPNSAPIRYRLVEAWLYAGQAAKAYTLLARLSPEDAASGDGLCWRGITAKMLGRPAEAVGLLRDSLARSPSQPALVWTELGKTYFMLQRYPEAIAAHREAVRLDPAADRRYWLSMALKDGGHLAEAIEIDRQLVAELPGEAGAWRQLGFAGALAGEDTTAIGALERSLALDAAQPRVWRALMKLYHGAGRGEDVRRAHDTLRGIDAVVAAEAYRELITPYDEAAR